MRSRGRAGYTCLACEYRLAGESLWPAQIDDVHTALAYFHDRAAALGVDAGRVAVAGNSAGGQLALLAAVLGERPIAAVAAFYSAVDFVGDDARAKGAPEAMAYLLGPDVSEARLAVDQPTAPCPRRLPAHTARDREPGRDDPLG